jgi:CubicO group peptidase (beta-lactamase class C family)
MLLIFGKEKMSVRIQLLPVLGLLCLSACQKPRETTLPPGVEETAKLLPVLDEGRLTQIDAVVESEIEKGHLPGAVVLVGCGEATLYFKAFGDRAIEPSREPMHPDTVFDLASLSKPVGTATSILILRDRNLIRLDDKVSQYLPAFACNGKEDVRIEHLLTHSSGLPAYTSAAAIGNEYGAVCPEKTLDKICSLGILSEPGEQFRYSCLGYIVLGKIVEVVSGQSLDVFARETIFMPLGMRDTFYNPPVSLQDRIAATTVLTGTVHDPLAALMGGVSGNAGIFSTAEDLAIYCRMLLNKGRGNRRQILSRESVVLLTTQQTLGRAYGFDVSSSYSNHLKGDSMNPAAFCHSGYTGTSIVCDPETKVFVIILTNSVHPEDKGTAKQIRTEIANLVGQFIQGLR